jgi:hypothetical protein
MKNEYVYILVHPVQDGYLKIGATTRTPEERAKEITAKASTGLVGKFIVAYEFEVEDCQYIERLVHYKLRKYRVNSNREFFYIKLFRAIKIIEEVIKEVKTQKKIDFLPDDDFFWWDNLPFKWKQILLSNINTIEYKPEEEEILEAINMVIKYCRNNTIRKKVSNLISNRDFVKNSKSWYNKLSKNDKGIFNNYIPRLISKEELHQIVNVEIINCSGNSLIEDLTPISYLEKVKKINFSSTSVSNIEPLRNLVLLEEISLNHTNVEVLTPIHKIESVKTIKCFQAKVNEEELEKLKSINPECKIIINPFE